MRQGCHRNGCLHAHGEQAPSNNKTLCVFVLHLAGVLAGCRCHDARLDVQKPSTNKTIQELSCMSEADFILEDVNQNGATWSGVALGVMATLLDKLSADTCLCHAVPKRHTHGSCLLDLTVTPSNHNRRSLFLLRLNLWPDGLNGAVSCCAIRDDVHEYCNCNY